MYGVLLLLFGLLFSIPSILFYVFFKKYAKTNKQAIALPILAIIFGGVLNLIAGIV
ncbi:hypothetical protein FACS189459_5790 [Bacilli bacterium]|nr:hypothetical protein FACS189459_5790 [Bacilli bacterium]